MTTQFVDRPLSDVWDESDEWRHGPALDGRPDPAYSEEAFRYFLSLERKRAECSGRSLLLLLVDVKTHPEGSARLSPSVSARLFAALGHTVRDVDFIGWYRDGRVAGAVLTQGADAPASGVSDRIRERVTEVLSDCLPAQIANRLQVRVLHARQQ